MNKKILLSLCIPTNGVSEWVGPVLDSIYSQGVDDNLYEIIITDNGNNIEFYDKIKNYINKHDNLIYKKTNAIQFLNQIESFKLASGLFIKFVNHRMMMEEGALQYLISYVIEHSREKQITYFLNGLSHKREKINLCKNFDTFVKELSYYSSWSGGLACWKDDFEKFSNEISYNKLFPHTTILFSEQTRNEYVIDNHVLFKEISSSHTKKGTYNLFYAFASEYMYILYGLFRNSAISLSTFLYIKNENKRFLINLYFDFIVMKKTCSYDLSGYKDYLSVFYSHSSVQLYALSILPYKIIRKMIKTIIFWI